MIEMGRFQVPVLIQPDSMKLLFVRQTLRTMPVKLYLCQIVPPFVPLSSCHSVAIAYETVIVLDTCTYSHVSFYAYHFACTSCMHAETAALPKGSL